MESLDNKTDAEKRKWLVLTVIVIKMIMDGLDGSMLNIALPSISANLGVTSSAIIWIVSSYSIATATTVLFFGRFGDIIGKSKFYLIGIAIYASSTLISGFANSLAVLVVARVIQGIGASCTMANSQGIITMVFPPHQRGRALGIYGGAISIGTLAGPTLGGIIVANMDWRYIFLLKVPIAALACILGLKFFPKETPSEKEKMDYPGAILFIVALVPLLYSLQEGYSRGYTSLTILSWIALSVVSFTAFFIIQRKKEMPLLDLSIFKNSRYSINLFTAFVLSFMMGFQGIIIPFYMQGVLNTPPDVAGMYMSVMPIIVLLVTPISGILSDKVGGEKLSVLGQGIIFIGLILMSTLTKDSTVLTMIIYLSVMSLGTSLFQAPNNATIMSSLPPDKLGIGGSAAMSIRNTGGSMSIALTTVILYGGMSSVLGYRVTGYIKESGMEEAFMYGMRNNFIFGAVLCSCSIIISIMNLIRIKKKEKKAAAA